MQPKHGILFVMLVIGVDEVGRGAWAGPLVVGAVLLSEALEGLKDSKLVSKIKREELDLSIRSNALFVGLGWVQPQEVDELGLTKATQRACERALRGAPEEIDIIIDGAVNFLAHNTRCKNLIKADSTVPSVSAASIVAKMARDRYMAACEKDFGGYGFDRHVGYGTKEHLQAIIRHGLTPLHRRSFSPVKRYSP